MSIDRTSNQYITLNGLYARRNIDAGDPPSGVPTESFVDMVIADWRDGSAVNPNWREDIKQGNCATTPLSGHRESLARTVASFSVSSTHGDFDRGTEVDEQLTWRAQDPAGVSISLADSLARTKIVRKANEYQRPFQGGVFLGELRETLRMIRNPAISLSKSISRHIDSLKNTTKGKRRGSDAYRKAVSGSWLEAVFGWLPFFSDIESGMKALDSYQRQASNRRKLVTAYSMQEIHGSARNGGDTHYGRGDIRVRGWQLTSSKVEVRYRAMLQWDASSYSQFRYFGLTPQDILPTAWELVPWSFLIDYFTNIGDMVEGFSFGSSRLRWVDRGYKVTTERQWRWEPHRFNLSPNGPGEGWFTPETLLSRRVYVDRREILNFNSVPDFRFEIPGSRQIANIAALFSNKRNLL